MLDKLGKEAAESAPAPEAVPHPRLMRKRA
ncbi:UNVERIFIED_ORG: hypothetical protein J2791_000637 [Burkholderia contaminans]|nr:hypothetical protein [Burkholderia contaminans]